MKPKRPRIHKVKEDDSIYILLKKYMMLTSTKLGGNGWDNIAWERTDKANGETIYEIEMNIESDIERVSISETELKNWAKEQLRQYALNKLI